MGGSILQTKTSTKVDTQKYRLSYKHELMMIKNFKLELILLINEP